MHKYEIKSASGEIFVIQTKVPPQLQPTGDWVFFKEAQIQDPNLPPNQISTEFLFAIHEPQYIRVVGDPNIMIPKSFDA